MTVRVTAEAAATALAALTALANVGGRAKIQLFAGTRPPVTDPIVAQVLLAEFEMAETAFQVPVAVPGFGATATAFPVATQEAVASGQASFFRVLTGEGDVLYDGEVSNSSGNGDLIVTSTTTSQGVDIVVTSFSITLPSN